VKARKIIRSQKGEDRRNVIVDAAAISFALDEFSGTSMRTIAARAGVSQSLIHYHFATKEQLFAEVFSRFMDPMNSRRIALIESFLKKGPRKKSQAIEELVQILIAPWIEITTSAIKPEREFARFVIRSAYHDDEWSQGVAVHHFYTVQDLGVQAFMRIVPEFDRNMAFRAYFLTLSMFYMALSAPNRLQSLADYPIDMTHPQALLKYGTLYAAAGVRALQADAADVDVPELPALSTTRAG